MTVEAPVSKLKPADFASDQELRWCPGCGDYAILKAIQKTLADVAAKRESTVFISGIGCSSRLPYYMSTYGFHTIHGRAPAFATGIKLANPELDVWLITGDGDGLSIGGNHMMHVLRRNVDVQILLFNNEIYGLTKGQYSPTSRIGTRSPSTPMGSVDAPVSPCMLALGSGARFVARAVDTAIKHLSEVLARAYRHKGASFVEIYQNCIVYNDKVFADFTEREGAPDHQLVVAHGKPLMFGADRQKGLRFRPGTMTLEVVTVGEGGVTEADVLVHDETNRSLAMLLAELSGPEFPVALGVLYCEPRPTYERAVWAQIEDASKAGTPRWNDILRRGYTWTVEP
ncbi:MAG TPA: 2-oxoacid:ferredoxin oxidoreductase subunit beta [Alphaproteobacteria bacterium]